MKLLIQEFLETHTLKELQEMHGVYASVSKNNRKISLNYDQIEAKESDLLSQDCRGLILAKSDFSEFTTEKSKLDDNVVIGETKIICFGMRRFFNHGQGSAANVNWGDPNLSILEKLDGTLIQLYYCPISQQWHTSTRSVPEADLLMDNGIFTFRTLFEKALKDTAGIGFEEYVTSLSKNNTYCFELTTPYNRIVVNYSDCRITLLAARSLKNNLEELALPHSFFGVPVVKAYTYTCVNDLLEWVSSLNPMEHEGVVVVDSQFNRIKVKNAAYVAYNKARDVLATSERNCLELILQEKDDDVKAFLPEEIVNNLVKIKTGFVAAVKLYDEQYQKALQEANTIAPGDKKTFAVLVTKDKSLWSAPFFQMFDGKASSMKDFIQRNRKDGTWSDSFLDKLLDLSKKMM